ncbi:hypothetical protein RUE5091_03560 [Ruegeria denitrificans]|uniref:Uncharacterized protein n=1 Tax=Ruegeria denitrificans TaxID=1715692 RepID=A0A0P1IH13_9RHOB|nr:hypothetical protein [Ruegeria denitrificans]CUK12702.1 hypothetical protein RUE5091_03560 [Ruegeria denitrificans]
MIRLALMLIFLAGGLAAQDAPEAEPPMDYERLGKILFALDPDAQPQGPGFELTLSDIPVLVVTDVSTDRMRAMVAIRNANELSKEELHRMMQANFDTALDARYAIANGIVWATFIHPLSSLKKDQLISGLAQTVNIATTYGTSYSGGAIQFGGGDSNELQRQLIEDLLKKGEEI